MINLSELSFQPKPVPISAGSAASTSSTTDTGAASSRGSFNSILGESQEMRMATVASEDAVEADLSDQKLIELEELGAESTDTLKGEKSLKDEKSLTEETHLADAATIKHPQDAALKPPVNTLNKALTNENGLKETDTEAQELGVSAESIKHAKEQSGLESRSAKTSDQEAIESANRPISIAELRSVTPESARSRHVSSLEGGAATRLAEGRAQPPITDKAIDVDKLSIKQPFDQAVDSDKTSIRQPFNTAVDAVKSSVGQPFNTVVDAAKSSRQPLNEPFDIDGENPVLVDKFEVDKSLLANKSKTESDELKLESLFNSAKEAPAPLDSRLLKNVGHTPISVQSLGGNFDLSGVASMGLKSEPTLPVGTLVLRQPGLDQSLATNISFMINEEMQSAKINVKPGELGPVSVQLAVRSDHLSVTLAASQVQTRETLESTLPRLKEQFASMGFTNVDVNVGEHHSQQQSNNSLADNRHTASSQGYQQGDDSANLDDVSFSVQSRVTHNGMLDTFA